MNPIDFSRSHVKSPHVETQNFASLRPNIGQPERVTQNRVIALFRDELHYRYLGDWRDREGNSNIEEYWLADHLLRSGYSYEQINKAIHTLRTEADKEFIYNTYTELLKDIAAKPGLTKTETYEERAKELFKKEPANMRLLIVVDKLLTGFDAPSCTYLYIDKSMQDHGLFQAISRTNRLDGEDKDFGYIVDYKDLFKKVENAIAVYTSELDHSDGSGVDPQILMKERLSKGRERLDTAFEVIALLCEPVEPPRGELEHIHYFCGNTEIPEDLAEREVQRAALYKATVALVRAFANIADELEAAG